MTVMSQNLSEDFADTDLPAVWIDGKGKAHVMDEMSNTHIRNVINYLWAHPELPGNNTWIRLFQEILNKRNQS